MKFTNIALLLAVAAVSTQAVHLGQEDDGPNWGKGGRRNNDPDWEEKSNNRGGDGEGEGPEDKDAWRAALQAWKADRPRRSEYADSASFETDKMAWEAAKPAVEDY